jgi:hypothetical protein
MDTERTLGGGLSHWPGNYLCSLLILSLFFACISQAYYYLISFNFVKSMTLKASLKGTVYCYKNVD